MTRCWTSTERRAVETRWRTPCPHLVRHDEHDSTPHSSEREARHPRVARNFSRDDRRRPDEPPRRDPTVVTIGPTAGWATFGQRCRQASRAKDCSSARC